MCKIIVSEDVPTFLTMNSVSSVKELASRVEGIYNKAVTELFIVMKEVREKLPISEKVQLEYFGAQEKLVFAVTLQSKKPKSRRKLK